MNDERELFIPREPGWLSVNEIRALEGFFPNPRVGTLRERWAKTRCSCGHRRSWWYRLKMMQGWA